MRSRRRTERTTETHEVWVVRRRSGGGPAWCEECAGQRGMLTPEEAATLARVSPRVIYKWVEAGRLHFTETADGALLVCPASLSPDTG